MDKIEEYTTVKVLVEVNAGIVEVVGVFATETALVKRFTELHNWNEDQVKQFKDTGYVCDGDYEVIASDSVLE